MFLSCCSPMSSKARSSLPTASSCTRGDADPTGLGQRFQTGGDIDSIAEDVPVLDHDVAHVDANAELNVLIRWYRGIALAHASLHLGCAPQGADHTAELDEQAITRRLDEPSIVRGDRRVNQFGADCLQRLEGAALVRPDQ